MQLCGCIIWWWILIKNICPLANEILGMDAKIGIPGITGGLVEEVNSPIYATGVGLVVHGCNLAQILIKL